MNNVILLFYVNNLANFVEAYSTACNINVLLDIERGELTRITDIDS